MEMVTAIYCALFVVLILLIFYSPCRTDKCTNRLDESQGRVWPRSFPAAMSAPYTYRDPTGLSEFSDGDEVGVSLGAEESSNEGIPSNWILPSTPIKWQSGITDDHYGVDGISTGQTDIYSLGIPDHEPYIGA
jgi:hypothetical protein